MSEQPLVPGRSYLMKIVKIRAYPPDPPNVIKGLSFGASQPADRDVD
jgi:hypothetical protein